LRMHDLVGVQTDHLRAAAEGHPPLVAAGALQQAPGPVGPLTKASAHQCDVRVEVHRLVRLVREIRIAFALERTHSDLEAAREPPIGTPQKILIGRVTLDTTQQVSSLLLVPTALAEQGHFDEYAI